MSRRSRLSLLALTVVLLVAPAAAFHPVVMHLYAAGLSNLSIELTHPGLLGLSLLALASIVPAAGFLLAISVAVRGAAHLRALRRASRQVSRHGFRYRRLPIDAVMVFSAGVIQPATFVSEGAERVLGAAGLRAALLHEEAHVHSQDIVWRLLLGAVGRGFRFFPWMSAVVDSETLRTECAADDYAIREGVRRVDLFNAIVAVSAPPANSLVAGLSDAHVELRLKRLVDPATPLPGRPATSFVALSAAVLLPAVGAHLLAAAALATSRLMV